jgi:anthraniloyl-CoA monooxygenase
MEIEQFTYSLLTRSQRISHENLRQRDSAWLGGYERWLHAQQQGEPLNGVTHYSKQPLLVPTPMLLSLTARSITLQNRVMVSPMAMYSAVDGMPGDFHLVHLGARAMGGAGLVMAEMTCVSPEARISPGCPGLWTDAQRDAWRRIVDFVHANSAAKIGIQIGHSGPKGSTQLGWQDNDEPLASGNWPLMAASAVPYGPQNQVPKAMDAADMAMVLQQFVQATRRAAEAGFDWLELHCAHGYLLSSFICPLTNQRTDEYGGSIDNRCRYPLEVFTAVRAEWPAHLPMSVRISAHDWAEGGNTADDAVAVARLFKAAGADFIDVSSGQTTRAARPVYGRMYQAPFADRIRNEVGIRTIAVGAITDADQVNSIIAAGRADLCAVARPHLADSAWTLHEAAKLGATQVQWPKPYWAGRDQLYRLIEKDKAAQAANAGLSAAQIAAQQLET